MAIARPVDPLNAIAPPGGWTLGEAAYREDGGDRVMVTSSRRARSNGWAASIRTKATGTTVCRGASMRTVDRVPGVPIDRRLPILPADCLTEPWFAAVRCGARGEATGSAMSCLDHSTTETTTETTVETTTYESPRRRFYYGWVMLPIATLTIIASSPAQTFGISAFNQSLRDALGLSHSQLTGAYMLGTLLASLPLTWIGALMDRFGLRLTLTAVLVIFGGVCIGTSQVTGLLSLFLAFFLLRLLGQGALGLLSGNTLAFWFRRRLGTVEGVRHFGMAGAIAVVPAINLWLIHAYGWRTAWVMLGAAVWLLVLPWMLLFRNRPADVGQHIDGAAFDAAGPAAQAAENGHRFAFAEVRRTRPFWIVGALTALWAMTNTAVLFNIVPLFHSRGLGEADAALLFTGFAASLAAMQLIGGVLADRYPLNRLLSVSAAGMAAALWMLWLIDQPWQVAPLSMMMGFSQGLLTTAGGPLWPRYYGTAHIGRIRGALATVMVSASSAGPFLMGVCVDWLGHYDPVLLLFALLPLPLILLALLATPPRPPRDDGSVIPHETPVEASA